MGCSSKSRGPSSFLFVTGSSSGDGDGLVCGLELYYLISHRTTSALTLMDSDQACLFFHISRHCWIKFGVEYTAGQLWDAAVVSNPYCGM
jgi:hypothetical protein